METHSTYCRICEALCGLEVDVESGRVVDVRPDKAHPMTQGYCCVKGIRMLDVHNDPDRLQYPQKRMPNGEFERISWKQALSEIGARVKSLRKQYGPHSIALYLGNPAAFSYSHAMFSQAFVMGLGTRNLYTAGSQDCNNKFVVARHLYGSSVIQGVPDFDNMNYFLCLGSNPAISQMSFVHAPRSIERLKAITRRGGKVVFVGPRRIESSHNVGEHVLIRPDTDVYFLAALLHVMDREGWLWRDGIGRYSRGAGELLQVVRPFSPSRVAEVTGIPATKIEEIARDFASAPGAGAYCSTGVNQGSAGTLAYWFLNALNFVTGNLDRQGGMVVTKPPLNMAGSMKKTGAEKVRHRSRIGEFEPVLGSLPAAILPDEILTPGDGQVRSLFVTAGNPILSCANSRRMREAISKLDLVVSLDLYRNETGDLAHYLLPTTDFFQRDDFPLPFTSLQPVPFVQYTEAVATPRGEQRQEWEIYLDLIESCGLKAFGMPGASTVFGLTQKIGKLPLVGEKLRLKPQHLLEAMFWNTSARISELKKTPRGKFLAPNETGTFLGKRVLHEDKKINLAPAPFLEEARGLGKKLEDAESRLRNGKELLLFSKRERFTHNSWMHNIPEFVKGSRKTNYAYLNPSDAAPRGIKDGGAVRVHNAWGSLVLPAKLTEDVIAGAIAIPHGWGHQQARGLSVASETSGVNPNELAPDGPTTTERLSGMTHMNGVPVYVESVSSAG